MKEETMRHVREFADTADLRGRKGNVGFLGVPSIAEGIRASLKNFDWGYGSLFLIIPIVIGLIVFLR